VTDDAARGPIPADPRAQSESAAAPGATRNVFPLHAAALTTCFGAHSGRPRTWAATTRLAPCYTPIRAFEPPEPSKAPTAQRG
jgi:hypothetical protein